MDKIQLLTSSQLQSLNTLSQSIRPLSKLKTLRSLNFPTRQKVESNLIDYNDPYAINSTADVITRTKLDNNPTGIVAGVGIGLDVLGDVALMAGGLLTLTVAGAPVGAALATAGKVMNIGGKLIKWGAVASDADFYEMMRRYYIEPIKQGDWQAVGYNALTSFSEGADLTAQPVKAFVPKAGGSEEAGWTNLEDTWQGMLGQNTGAPRYNYDYDTGNLVEDIGLEIISDPLDILEFAVKIPALATKGAKKIGKAAKKASVIADGVVPDPKKSKTLVEEAVVAVEKESTRLGQIQALTEFAEEKAYEVYPRLSDVIQQNAIQRYKSVGSFTEADKYNDLRYVVSEELRRNGVELGRFYEAEAALRRKYPDKNSEAYKDAWHEMVEELLTTSSNTTVQTNAINHIRDRNTLRGNLYTTLSKNLKLNPMEEPKEASSKTAEVLSKNIKKLKTTEAVKKVYENEIDKFLSTQKFAQQELFFDTSVQSASEIAKKLTPEQQVRYVKLLEHNITTADSDYLKIDLQRGKVLAYTNLARHSKIPQLQKHYHTVAGKEKAKLAKLLRRTPEEVAGVSVRAIQNTHTLSKIGKASLIARMSLGMIGEAADLTSRSILKFAINTAGPFPLLMQGLFKGGKKLWGYGKYLWIQYNLKHIDELRLDRIFGQYRAKDGTLDLNKLHRLVGDVDQYSYRSSIETSSIIKANPVVQYEKHMDSLADELKNTLLAHEKTLNDILSSFNPEEANLQVEDLLKLKRLLQEMLPSATLPEGLSGLVEEIRAYLDILRKLVRYTDSDNVNVGRPYFKEFSSRINTIVHRIDDALKNHESEVKKYGDSYYNAALTNFDETTNNIDNYIKKKSKPAVTTKIEDPETKQAVETPLDLNKLSDSQLVRSRRTTTVVLSDEDRKTLTKDWGDLQDSIKDILEDISPGFKKDLEYYSNSEEYILNLIWQLQYAYPLNTANKIDIPLLTQFLLDGMTLPNEGVRSVLEYATYKDNIAKLQESLQMLALIAQARDESLNSTIPFRDHFIAKPFIMHFINAQGESTAPLTKEDFVQINKLTQLAGTSYEDFFKRDYLQKLYNIETNLHLDLDWLDDLKDASSEAKKKHLQNKLDAVEKLKGWRTTLNSMQIDIDHFKQVLKERFPEIEPKVFKKLTKYAKDQTLLGILYGHTDAGSFQDILRKIYYPTEHVEYKVPRLITDTAKKLDDLANDTRIVENVTNNLTAIAEGKAYQVQHSISRSSMDALRNTKLRKLFSSKESPKLHATLRYLIDNSWEMFDSKRHSSEVPNILMRYIKTEKEFEEVQQIAKEMLNTVDNYHRNSWLLERVYSTNALRLHGASSVVQEAALQNAVWDSIKSFWNVSGRTFYTDQDYYTDQIIDKVRTYTKVAPVYHPYKMDYLADRNKQFLDLMLRRYNLDNSAAAHDAGFDICRLESLLRKEKYAIAYPDNEIHCIVDTEYTISGTKENITKNTRTLELAYKERSRPGKIYSDYIKVDLKLTDAELANVNDKTYKFYLDNHKGSTKADFKKQYYKNGVNREEAFKEFFTRLHRTQQENPGKRLRLIAHNGVDADFKLLRQEFEHIKPSLVCDANSNPTGIFVNVAEADAWIDTLLSNSIDTYTELLKKDGVPVLDQQQVATIRQIISEYAELSKEAAHIGRDLDSIFITDAKTLSSIITDPKRFEFRTKAKSVYSAIQAEALAENELEKLKQFNEELETTLDKLYTTFDRYKIGYNQNPSQALSFKKYLKELKGLSDTETRKVYKVAYEKASAFTSAVFKNNRDSIEELAEETYAALSKIKDYPEKQLAELDELIKTIVNAKTADGINMKRCYALLDEIRADYFLIHEDADLEYFLKRAYMGHLDEHISLKIEDTYTSNAYAFQELVTSNIEGYGMYTKGDFLADLKELTDTTSELLATPKAAKDTAHFLPEAAIHDHEISIRSKKASETAICTNLTQASYHAFGGPAVNVKTIYDADLKYYFNLPEDRTEYTQHLDVMRDIRTQANAIQYPEHLLKYEDDLGTAFELLKKQCNALLPTKLPSKVPDQKLLRIYSEMIPTASLSERFIQTRLMWNLLDMHKAEYGIITDRPVNLPVTIQNLLDGQDSRLYTNRLSENHYVHRMLEYQDEVSVSCDSAFEKLNQITEIQEKRNALGFNKIRDSFKARTSVQANGTVRYDAFQFNKKLKRDSALLKRVQDTCAKIPEKQLDNRLSFLNDVQSYEYFNTVDRFKLQQLKNDLVYNPLHTLVVSKDYFKLNEETIQQLIKEQDITVKFIDDKAYFYLSPDEMLKYSYDGKTGKYYRKNIEVPSANYDHKMFDNDDHALDDFDKVQNDAAELYEMDLKNFGDSYGRVLTEEQLQTGYNNLPEEIRKAIGSSEDLLNPKNLKGRLLFNNVFIDRSFCPEILPEVQDPIVNYLNMVRDATEELDVRSQYAHFFFDSSDKMLLNDPKNVLLKDDTFESIADLCGAIEVDGDYVLSILIPTKKGAAMRVMQLPTDNPALVQKLLKQNQAPIKLLSKREYSLLKNMIEAPYTNKILKIWRQFIIDLKSGWLAKTGTIFRNLLDTTLKTVLDIGVKDTLKYSRDAMVLDHQYNKAVKAISRQSFSNGILNDDVVLEFFSRPELLKYYKLDLDYETFNFIKAFKESDASAAIVKAQENYIKYGKAYRASKFYKTGNVLEHSNRYLSRLIDSLEEAGRPFDNHLEDLAVEFRRIENRIIEIGDTPELQNSKTLLQEAKQILEQLQEYLSKDLENKTSSESLAWARLAYKEFNHLFEQRLDEGNLADYLKSTRKLPKGQGPKAILKQARANVFNAYNWMLSIISTPNTKVEEINRLTMFLKYADEGYLSNQEIFKQIKRVHFDYSFKTRATTLVENFVPFYNFTKANATYWLEMLDERPEVIRILQNVMTPIQNLDGYSVEELEYNPALVNAIMQGYITLDKDTGLMLKANPSFIDVFTLFTNPVEAVQNRLIPIGKNAIDALTDWENFNAKDLLNNIPWGGTLYQTIESAKRNHKRLNEHYASHQTPLIRQGLNRAAATISSAFTVPYRYRSAKYTSSQYYRRWRNYRSPVRSIYTKTGISKLQILMEPVSPDNIKYKLGVMQSFVNRQ